MGRFDWREFVKAAEDTPAETIAALDEYFAPFAAIPFEGEGENRQVGKIECVKCGTIQNPGLMGLIVGGFEWGLAHGEGRCSKCGWPARAHHWVKDASGETFLTLRGFVVQYHPDFVIASTPEIEDED